VWLLPFADRDGELGRLAAAQHAQAETGKFWHDRIPRPYSYLRSVSDTAAERDELWQICQRLTGQDQGQDQD